MKNPNDNCLNDNKFYTAATITAMEYSLEENKVANAKQMPYVEHYY